MRYIHSSDLIERAGEAADSASRTLDGILDKLKEGPINGDLRYAQAKLLRAVAELHLARHGIDRRDPGFKNDENGVEVEIEKLVVNLNRQLNIAWPTRL